MKDENKQDSVDDFVADENRLKTALQLLGMEKNSPMLIRFGLVSRIWNFAGVTGDKSLESQCKHKLAEIMAE